MAHAATYRSVSNAEQTDVQQKVGGLAMSLESGIESILAGLSLREKIGQTSQELINLFPTNDAARLADLFQHYPVGSLFVGGEIIKDAVDPSDTLREAVGLCQAASSRPLSIAGDLENGAGGAVKSLTAFANLMALGAVNDSQMAWEYGKWTAHEAREVGFNWTFGPVVDLALNWLNPAVNTRCLGRDPQLVSELTAALIRGYQENGLSATAKHFPGDGVDLRDQHLCVSVNHLSEEQWLASFGHVYRTCFNAGVHSVMAGHIALPWQDPRTKRRGRPIPATVSGPLLTKLLRDRLGFDGVLVSDALIMAGFTAWAPYEERMIEAFNAGVDVMLWPGFDYFGMMERALEDGHVSEKRLDESVRRVLAMKIKQGLITTEASEIPEPVRETLTLAANPKDFARNLAEKSVTLVRNDRSLLPLNPETTQTMLVLYATAYTEQGEKRIAPLLEVIRAYGVEVTVMINGNCLDIHKREEAGERYDALLTVFDMQMHSVKNAMRPVGPMAECIWTMQYTETMSPIVISLGTPFLLNDLPFAETLVNAYSGTRESQEAAAKAIFGENEFAGVSPVDVGGDWVQPALEFKMNATRNERVQDDLP
jgi:beta-N-acetylhexosaminidase